MIKKTILMLLVLVGGVMTANAEDVYSIGSDESGWGIRGQMTANEDGTYSYIINFPADYDNYLFTIFEGDEIASDWSNAYRPVGAGANWGLVDNNTPTLQKGANNYVLTYNVSGTRARAIKVDFTPSTGQCVVTRLIAVASGYNHWSTTTDYLEETSRGSNVYQGTVALEKESTDYDDGFQFVAINGKALKYYSNKENTWIDTNQYNALVSADGYYKLEANFDTYAWVAPVRFEVSATLGAYGYTTFASEYPLDLDNITDATAYYVTATPTTSVKLIQATGTVPAGEGLVLYGEPSAEITIPAALSGSAISGNLLKGCTAATVLDGNTTGYESIYVLVNTDTRPEFQNVKNWIDGNHTVSIPAGKAYLNASGVSAPSFSLEFDDETTGIANIERTISDNQYYTLDGRRVAQPTKGLYIVDGKKVIIK